MKTITIVILFLVGMAGAHAVAQGSKPVVTVYEIPCYSSIDTVLDVPELIPILNDELWFDLAKAVFDTLYRRDNIIPDRHYFVILEESVVEKQTTIQVTYRVKSVRQKFYPDTISANEYQFPCYAIPTGGDNVCMNCILDGLRGVSGMDSVMSGLPRLVVPWSRYLITVEEVQYDGKSFLELKAIFREEVPKVLAQY